MIEVNWQETSTGFRCNILNKYVLEVWKVGRVWYAGVNEKLIKDSHGDHQSFKTPEEAQAAAERLAQKIMFKEGIPNSAEH